MSELRIHSKYNPQREAQQFVNTIKGSYSFFVVTEPGESYLAEPLRERFPDAVFIAIRYSSTLFYESDTLWDFVWRPRFGSLPFFLLNHIPDERLSSTCFFSWKPSDRAFPEESTQVWNDIQTAISMIKQVMYTRSFFGKRWFKNTIKNAIYLKKPATLHFGTQDFLLTGAGPSLSEINPTLSNYLSTVTVSSAFSALAYKGIKPDLCISTDAGYWALRHFDRINPSIPIAFPFEAAIPSSILEHNYCIPLSYGSPLERELFQQSAFTILSAKENGTVMGTALELLLRHTHQHVFVAGLDLAATKGFSHVQPHNSTLFASQQINKVHSLTGTLAVQNFNTESLSVYRNWFLQLPSIKANRITYLGNIALAAQNKKNAEEQLKKSAKNASSLFITPDTAFSSKERQTNINTFLQQVKKNISTVIFEAPKSLIDDSAKLEKQICALCDYTGYCRLLKTPYDTDTQKQLHEQITIVLDFIVKRIRRDEWA